MRAVGVLALAAVATLGSGAVVRAHDHRVPRANLHANAQVKRLQPWSFTWESRSGPGCVSQVADGIPDFRPRIEVDHRHAKPRIVFRKRQRPQRVRAFADDQLRNGYLADGKALDLTLHVRRRGDRRVWVAKLRATVKDRLFVDVYARWRDRDGCGGSQDASWDFGLRRAK